MSRLKRLVVEIHPVTAYFAMRITGVGPVASLVAQGVLEERDPILLADFGNTTNDAGLGSVVTEALRVDLASSRVVALVEVSQVQEALRRMERDPAAGLRADVAREMAVRDGIKAVLEGEVGGAGTGYILTATLRAAADGATLASFRRTAAGPDAVIGAIDQLSRDVRERVGESLRSIRGGAPLWQVTTSSLDALRRYSEAEQALARGDEMGGLALLREAVALDSAFAMAYRKEAVLLRNLGIDRVGEIEAVERAYHHRTRLPEKERYLAEAAYHNSVTRDKDALVRAVRGRPPHRPRGSGGPEQPGQRVPEHGRAGEGGGAIPPEHSGAVAFPHPSPEPGPQPASAGGYGGSPGGPGRLRRGPSRGLPRPDMGFWVHAFSGEMEAANRELDALIDPPGIPASRRATALMNRGLLLAVQGRMREARRELEAAARTGGEVTPALEQFHRMARMWIDVWAAGDTARAAAALGELGRSGLVERVPVEARDFNFLVSLHLMVGDPGGALEQLDRWRRELPEELVTPETRANQTFYGVWARSGRDNPAAVLEALGILQRDRRCSWCVEWERPHLLSRLGRTEEARRAWMDLLERSTGNFPASLGVLPVALQEVGRLSEELGDRAAAADALPAVRRAVGRCRSRAPATGRVGPCAAGGASLGRTCADSRPAVDPLFRGAGGPSDRSRSRLRSEARPASVDRRRTRAGRR